MTREQYEENVKRAETMVDNYMDSYGKGGIDQDEAAVLAQFVIDFNDYLLTYKNLIPRLFKEE